EGGLLATFKGKMEEQIILNELYRGFSESPKVIWIGLDRLEDHKTYKWIDNGVIHENISRNMIFPD
ncbi:hypothetical protein BgiMline_021750, partial [Biomphalaria glabrata]